ncbi:MAG: ABC transporter substrate-binding protein [Actinomycetes bacterium]
MASSRRLYRAVATLFAASLLVTSCADSGSSGSDTGGDGAAAGGELTVAAFGFGESKILANMYSLVLAQAGYDTSVKELTTREVVGPALEKGEVDVVPEYLGTYTEYLNLRENGPDAEPLASSDVESTFTNLEELADSVGVTVLEPSPAQDQNAFAVTNAFAEQNDISTLSELGALDQALVLGGPPECPKRPFCQPGLENTYGVTVSEFTALDAGGPLTKDALAQGTIDVGLVFSSDGGIEALDLTVLEDDLGLQTAENITPAVNNDSFGEAIAEALAPVSSALTTEDLVALNKQVDIDREQPADVAQQWLEDQGLLTSS